MKKVLFYNPVPWTYHVNSARFLADFFKKSGFEVFFLTCNYRRTHCYPKLLNGDTKFQCYKCRIANLYLLNGFSTPIQVSPPQIFPNDLKTHWSSKGSVLSANRLELEHSDQEKQYSHEITKTNDDFISLKSSISEKIQTIQPDFCVIFNGRTHDTAAAVAACNEKKTRFISIERPWFGKGIQLVDNHDCISIKGFNEAIYGNNSKDPSVVSKNKAFMFIKNRLAGLENNEWRNYGQKLNSAPIFCSNLSEKYALIVPSSRAEFIGHPEYSLGNNSSIDFMEIFLRTFILPRVNGVVIRAHPAWFKKIGKYKSSKAHHEYSALANRIGAKYIPPDAKTSTYDLMKNATINIFNGSSSICEAMELSARVLNLGPHRFASAGFFKSFPSFAQISEDEIDEIFNSRVKNQDRDKMYDFIARYLENMVFFSSSFPGRSFDLSNAAHTEDGKKFRTLFGI